MPDAPQVLWRCGKLLGGNLLLRVDVKQLELDADFSAIHIDLACHQRLGLDLPPVGKARLLVEIRNLLDEGILRQGLEVTGTAQIIADHFVQGCPRFLRPATHQKRRDGDGQVD